MTMAGTTDPIEMLTVSDENIAVEEQLSRKNGGWVISFTLTSKSEFPIATRISVPMPDEPTRQDVGFHPKHEPQTWGIRDGILTFEDTVPSDEPLQILLGIVLVEDEDVTLSLSEPTIELSQRIESEDAEEPVSEESPIFRSNSVGVSNDAGSSTPSGTATTNDGTVDRRDSDDSVMDSDEPDVTQDPESTASTDDEVPLEEAIDLDRLSEISEEFEEPTLDDSSVDSGSESSTSEDEVFGDFQSKTADEGEASIDTSPDSKSSAPRSAKTDTSDDLLSRLVDEIESSDPGDDEIEVLREYLVPESQKSVDVRMQHIQSRMDDLAAYTEALEGLINKHGTASEFMSKIETELDEVSTEIEAVRSETTAADNDRQKIRTRLSGVESTVEEVDDNVRARLDKMYEELDSIRESVDKQDERVQDLREAVYDHDDELERLDDRVKSTDDQLEDHRDALDQRLSTLSNQLNELQDTFETDLSRLQDEVESLAEMRSVFAQAFAGQDIEGALGDEEESENSPEAEDEDE